MKVNVFTGFEKDIIRFVDNIGPQDVNGDLIIKEEELIEHLFLESHSHIGLQHSAKDTGQYEE